jgi:hypothetical protein
MNRHVTYGRSNRFRRHKRPATSLVSCEAVVATALIAVVLVGLYMLFYASRDDEDLLDAPENHAKSEATAHSRGMQQQLSGAAPFTERPLWWHAPFTSGGGYSSEAVGFVTGLYRTGLIPAGRRACGGGIEETCIVLIFCRPEEIATDCLVSGMLCAAGFGSRSMATWMTMECLWAWARG